MNVLLSHSLIKTEIYNKVKWTGVSESNFCEWIEFFKSIGKYGRICMDTSIISSKKKPSEKFFFPDSDSWLQSNFCFNSLNWDVADTRKLSSSQYLPPERN